MKYQDGQHFLMSPECRDMPIQHLVKIDEEEAYAIFRQFRWPKTRGQPVCPHCGVLDCYALRRRAFKCSGAVASSPSPPAPCLPSTS
ncbi:MAG: transposase [Mesorhizobium sp.]|nr:MAG: transposase [Mesorhizobium sp.]TIS88372.1 MAG: transposase [Mesorhizobium sp.]